MDASRTNRNRTRKPTPRRMKEQPPSKAPVGLIAVAAALVMAFAIALFVRSQGTQDGTTELATSGTPGVEATQDDATQAEGNDEPKASESKASGDAASSADAKKTDKESSAQTTAKTGNNQAGDASKGGEAASTEADAANGQTGKSSGGTADSAKTDASSAADGSGSSSDGSGSASGSANGSSADGSAYVEPTYVGPTLPATYVSSDWMWGEACASSVAEAGTITSSQIPFDDGVPQVALEYGSGVSAYFGRYVEVRYGGIVVRAQVVDTGAYNGGVGGIMLNPAVFEQFGVWSVDEWGRRMVEYRLVD